MKYLLLGDDYKKLFIEDDEQTTSIRFDPKEDDWVPGFSELLWARIGFDPSEPEDSPYRYGNLSCMPDIVEITHEEAEAFISQKINEAEVLDYLMWIKEVKDKMNKAI